MQETDFDVVIVGGGIVGLATAYKLSKKFPNVKLAVLEKEQKLAFHQTGHNSGVIHSGLYYAPGSQKAITCAKGRGELVDFAKQHSIAHDICGKIIVATQERELAGLERVYKNGVANGIEGIEKITPQRIKEIEPYCNGIAGLWVPCTGVIDFVQVAEKFAELVKANSANEVRTGWKVTDFRRQGDATVVLTDKKEVRAKFVINCAGLQCDRIARMYGVDTEVRIVPFRGDYMELTSEAAAKVNKLIYPVPDERFPFLGVHFTRMIAGGVECGPNAVFSLKREGYGKFSFSFKDAWDSLSHIGTWVLFAGNLSYGLGEYARCFCKPLMLKQLRRLISALESRDLVKGKSGVRAQALGPKGELIDDFKIETTGNSIHVLNAPSPAATASLAIGEHITSLAESHFELA
jgi:L-2-hydroxyglutarate oxidase